MKKYTFTIHSLWVRAEDGAPWRHHSNWASRELAEEIAREDFSNAAGIHVEQHVVAANPGGLGG